MLLITKLLIKLLQFNRNNIYNYKTVGTYYFLTH